MDQIASNIFVETGYEGVNVGTISTTAGLIAIDAPSYTRQARDWALRLSAMHHKPLQNLILTDYNGDRIMNSKWFNTPIITHAKTAEKLTAYDRRYPAHLLESLSIRNPAKGRELFNSPVIKATISFEHDLQLFKGDNEIQLIAAPGPTHGNIWVFVPEARIIFVGDTLTTSIPPIIYDGSCAVWLQSLTLLQSKLATVDAIVPGRGQLATAVDIERLVQYLHLMQDYMESWVDEERPFAEIATYIPEFMNMYPHHNLPSSWIRTKTHLTLNQVYNEIKFRKSGIVSTIEEEELV